MAMQTSMSIAALMIRITIEDTSQSSQLSITAIFIPAIKQVSPIIVDRMMGVSRIKAIDSFLIECDKFESTAQV